MTLMDDAWDDDDKRSASRKKARDGEIAKLAREVAKTVIDEEIEPAEPVEKKAEKKADRKAEDKPEDKPEKKPEAKA